MAEYRIIHAHLMTGAILGELPFTDATAEWTLNSPGRLQVTAPLSLANVTLKLPDQVYPQEIVLENHATAIYLERDGQILWGGILWEVEANVEADTLSLVAEGFHTYFRRRVLWFDRSYSSYDQLVIAKDMIDLAQAAEFGGGDIGIDTSDFAVPLSFRMRARNYYGFELKTFGEIIEELAAVDDGFDYYYESAWDGDEIVTRFLSSYPASGRWTEHVFDLGVNVAILSYSADLSVLANQVHALGSGDGVDKLRTRVSDLSTVGAWPLLESITTHSSVTETQTLIDHANRRLLEGSAPKRTITLAVFPNTIPVLGSYKVGDVVNIRGRVGYLDLDGYYRITSLQLSIDNSGAEISHLTAVSQELF